jgi:hypothetical protein
MHFKQTKLAASRKYPKLQPVQLVANTEHVVQGIVQTVHRFIAVRNMPYLQSLQIPVWLHEIHPVIVHLTQVPKDAQYPTLHSVQLVLDWQARQFPGHYRHFLVLGSS